MEVIFIKLKDIKIVIGAGDYMNNPGWLHTQENELNLLDSQLWATRFNEGTIQAILAEHVWEHLTYEEGKAAAKLCHQYLKKNGYVRCAVPDGFFQNEIYQNIVKVGGPGPVDHPAYSHKVVYDYKKLCDVFESAGFEVHLIEYFDEEGVFHYRESNDEDGVIFRSKKHDPRNQGESMVFPSLIIDAIKK